MSTSQTDARAEARDRFYKAALWHAADLGCSSAYAEFEDAYAALYEIDRAAVTERLSLTPKQPAASIDHGGRG